MTSVRGLRRKTALLDQRTIGRIITGYAGGRALRVLASLILICVSLRGWDTTAAVLHQRAILAYVYPTGVDAEVTTNGLSAIDASERGSHDAKRLSEVGPQSETNGFVAILYVTTNEVFGMRTNAFGLPPFKPITKVKRGMWFFPAVVFANPGVQSDGKTNVRLDLTVRKPDGSVCNMLSGMVVTQDSFSSPDKRFHLARDSQSVCLAEDEPLGTYTVEAVVKDKVNQAELKLVRRLVVEK